MATNVCPLHSQQLMTAINVIIGFVVLNLGVSGHYESCTIKHIIALRRQGVGDNAVLCEDESGGMMSSSAGCILQGVVELEETSLGLTSIFLILSTGVFLFGFYKDLTCQNSLRKAVAIYNLCGGAFVILAASFIIFGAGWIGGQSSSESGRKLCPEANFVLSTNSGDSSSMIHFWILEKFFEKGFAGFFGIINGIIYIIQGVFILKSVIKQNAAEEEEQAEHPEEETQIPAQRCPNCPQQLAQPQLLQPFSNPHPQFRIRPMLASYSEPFNNNAHTR